MHDKKSQNLKQLTCYSPRGSLSAKLNVLCDVACWWPFVYACIVLQTIKFIVVYGVAAIQPFYNHVLLACRCPFSSLLKRSNKLSRDSTRSSSLRSPSTPSPSPFCSSTHPSSWSNFASTCAWFRRVFKEKSENNKKKTVQNQVILLATDVHMDLLFLPIPLFPQPAGYCVGLACQWGVPIQKMTVSPSANFKNLVSLLFTHVLWSVVFFWSLSGNPADHFCDLFFRESQCFS